MVQANKALMALAAENLERADKDRPIVYISGPITKGNKNHNIFQAMEAHQRLLLLRFSVIDPMPSMLYPFNNEIEHQAWLENDLPHVRVASAVLRLPGESLGAEMECLYAEQCGVPIYHSIEELLHDHESGKLKSCSVQRT